MGKEIPGQISQGLPARLTKPMQPGQHGYGNLAV